MMGEEAAAKWYIDQGYQILARNWRCGDGELDLIAR
ncbi:MAG TPA: YraN family protein, partial [Patescibacteria group bacterium]|nr:YraN family protein [Patescibacteria group bacterium]